MLILLAFLLGWAASDPLEGTWKLNVARSSGTIPTDETVVVHADGNRLVVEIFVVNSDAAKTKFTIKYSAPIGGGEGQVMEGPYSGVSVKRPDSSTLETTFILRDANVRTTTAVVSKDGKSMTSTGHAMGDAGKAAWVMSFDKLTKQ